MGEGAFLIRRWENGAAFEDEVSIEVVLKILVEGSGFCDSVVEDMKLSRAGWRP